MSLLTAHSGAPVRPFTEAGIAGVGLLVFGAALVFGSKALAGGILPR